MKILFYPFFPRLVREGGRETESECGILSHDPTYYLRIVPRPGYLAFSSVASLTARTLALVIYLSTIIIISIGGERYFISQFGERETPLCCYCVSSRVEDDGDFS